MTTKYVFDAMHRLGPCFTMEMCQSEPCQCAADISADIIERCAMAAQSVTARRYGEQSEDWQTGFDRGGNAAATAIRELINPPQATANK